MNFKIKYTVYPTGEKCKLTLEPVFPVKIDENEEYSIIIRPFSGLKKYGLRNSVLKPTEADEAFFSKNQKLSVNGENLTIDVTFPQEDCYRCNVFIGESCVETIDIYALNEDLFALTPFRGDNHIHTCMSDGHESPMYMAAVACFNGNDYCLITDHYKYEPSLIAADFYSETDVDFLVIPGEEVHSPDNPVHIINFGGKESVNAWFRNDEDAYRKAVEAEMEKITDPMTAADKYSAAACQVIFDKIRSVDGLSILCHPYWIVQHGYNETEDITDYLFDHKRFDIFELIAGGAHEEGTQLQISYYHDREEMPIVGSSDTHSCFGGGLEPGNYTIVFAEDLSVESIKKAISSKYTVAGFEKKLYGNVRLVKYAYFLLRSYYPTHKGLRRDVGHSMLRMASSLEGKQSDFAKNLNKVRPSELFSELKYKA